jgi:quinolinate synthase
MTRGEVYISLKRRLRDAVPDAELRIKAELAYEINRLKDEKDALILAHHYMEPVLYHSVADIKGDSLQLSRAAAQTDKRMIVFCGVRFMAETAKILNPGKTVLLPSDEAGCSLAESIDAGEVQQLRREFPGVPVVSYINTSVEVKAGSDICCTSANAVAVIRSLGAEKVIFLPDEYLARNVADQTDRMFIDSSLCRSLDPSAQQQSPKMIAWHGRCEVHEKYSREDVENVRRQFPDAVILAHPECKPEVVGASDFSGSTSAMIQFIAESSARRFLLLTECAMRENVAALFPGKEMLRLCSVRCRYMNRITLESVLDSLRRRQYEIEIPEEIRLPAARALERMAAAGASSAQCLKKNPRLTDSVS